MASQRASYVGAPFTEVETHSTYAILTIYLCLSIYASIHPSIIPSDCLSVCCLSIYPSIHLSIHAHMCALACIHAPRVGMFVVCLSVRAQLRAHIGSHMRMHGCMCCLQAYKHTRSHLGTCACTYHYQHCA